MRGIDELSGKQQKFDKAVKEHMDTYYNVETKLDSLHLKSYETISDKKDVPVPAQSGGAPRLS